MGARRCPKAVATEVRAQPRASSGPLFGGVLGPVLALGLALAAASGLAAAAAPLDGLTRTASAAGTTQTSTLGERAAPSPVPSDPDTDEPLAPSTDDEAEGGDDLSLGEGETSTEAGVLDELLEGLGPVADTPTSTAPRYTRELSDAELERRWRQAPATLGAISLGLVSEGRLVNGVPFPRDDAPPGREAWVSLTPDHGFGTEETIAQVVVAARRVKSQFPDALPLRVNALSARDGGYVRPHKTHQNGRDVDLGFYYDTPTPARTRAKEKIMNVAQNWALLEALVLEGDVQVILLDKRVQRVLREHAERIGADRAWLDRLFVGPSALVQHARGHRDHFHVRYWNGRAQELGRRVAPLLALRPEENVAFVRVRRGDTLGHLARQHSSTVAAIKKQNRLRSNFLRVGQVLRVQRRGPCTACPVPPPVIVPPRCLPGVDVAVAWASVAPTAPPTSPSPPAERAPHAAPTATATVSTSTVAQAARARASLQVLHVER
jgi:LysM repeat protein